MLAAVLFATTTSAQNIDRAKRPATPHQPSFKFPKIESQTLANGLRVIVV